MIIIISVAILLIYITALLLLKGGVLFFGVDYIFTFISILMSYASEQPFSIPYYDFTITEVQSLKTGSYIQLLFFILFTFFGFALKIADSKTEKSELKIKRTLSWFLFFTSLIPLFGCLNNYSEAERQEKLLSHFNDLKNNEKNENMLLNDSIILNSELTSYEQENKRIVVYQGNYIFQIKDLKIKEKEEYVTLLKERFSYNLNIKQSKETLFKKNSALVIEYYLNKDYNRDYVVRVDQKFFVLSLRTPFDEKELALKEFKNFLIYSVYLYKE